MATPAWKLGRAQAPTQVSVGDLINSARNFYNNRFDIIDRAVSDLQTRKNMGQVSDLQFIDRLKGLQSRQRGGFLGEEGARPVADLQNQAQTAVAQQVYNDYIQNQKAQIQKTIDAAELDFASSTDDYQQGRLGRDAYLRKRDAYFNFQKGRADLENTLPKFSYEQFAPGKALSTYQSGRMRDIERERVIRDQARAVFGADIPASSLYKYAGSYMPTDAIKSIFEQQKGAGFKAPQSNLSEMFTFSEPKYNFPGTGGRAQLPTENLGQRNYYR